MIMTNMLAPASRSAATDVLLAAARTAAAGDFPTAAALFEVTARTGARYAELRTPDLPTRCVVMPFVGWFGFDRARLAAAFRAHDVLLVPLDERPPRHAPWPGLTLENWQAVAHRDVRLWDVARYEICLQLQRTVAELEAELEAELPALLPSVAQWYGAAAGYLDRADVLTQCYDPDAVVYAQGHLAASAALRRVALARGIRTVAIENTLHKDRLLWDDVSGVTVNLNLARNFWWRYEHSVNQEDAEAFCARFFADRAHVKQDEHRTPTTARPPALPDGGAKTLLYLGQVYTDSSVLFNTHAAWGSQLDVIRAAARHARERGWRFVVKLHPKEHAPAHMYGGFHHRVTQQRLASDPWFAAVLGEPWLTVDADNQLDTLALIDAADACVTITSQAGLEAAVRGKEVVLCGQAFYGGLGFTHEAADDGTLAAALDAILARGQTRNRGSIAQRFFQIFLDRYCVPRTVESVAALALGGRPGTPRGQAASPPPFAPPAEEPASLPPHAEGKSFAYHSGERQTATRIDGIRADHRARYEMAAATLRELGGAGAQLLGVDLFCGNGYGTHLVSRLSGASVLGVDGSAEAIDIARAHFSDARARYEHAVFPFELPAGEFDFALCFESIEHVDDGAALVQTLGGALKPGGVLFVSTPNEAALPIDLNRDYFRHHTRHFHAHEVVALAADAGLQAVCAFGQDVYHAPEKRAGGLRPESEMRIAPAREESQFLVHVFRKG